VTVVVTVTRHLVSFLHDAPSQLWVRVHSISLHKEAGAYPVAPEAIEYDRGGQRIRAIVERQSDLRGLAAAAPKHAQVQGLEQQVRRAKVRDKQTAKECAHHEGSSTC
jgi:hypothetical protein